MSEKVVFDFNDVGKEKEVEEPEEITPKKEVVEAVFEEEEESPFEDDEEDITVEEDVITIEEPPTPKKSALAISTQTTQIQNVTNLPSVNEVDAFLAMYNHVKKSIVDKSDFHNYKGTPRMKKSGWRKFIKPFNLSVELIREEDLGKENPHVYEKHTGPDGKPDVHAEVWVKVSVTNVSCPNCKLEIKGQFIESVGLKSKSEYWSPRAKKFGSYNLHNLITTARTRAENAGISDLVGFGEVSFEEISSSKNEEEEEWVP